jgi:release factor glutamine methyltransferase
MKSTQIYQPAEDSFFFADTLKEYLKTNEISSYLDMGTGSGILAETAEKAGIKKQDILTADINPQAIKQLKKKGFKSIQTDLFSKIPSAKKFDLITFNAPYLPQDPREPKDSQIATTGGKKGDEISLKFLAQAKKHLAPKGKILLLISSLTPQDKIKQFNPKTIARKKIFFEELLILEIS